MVVIAIRLLAFVALVFGSWTAVDWLLDPRLPHVLSAQGSV